MIKLIIYNLSGKIIENQMIEPQSIEEKTLGQRVRITLDYEKTYEGLTDNTFNSKTKKKLVLVLYDIDEEHNKLRSDKGINIFIPLKKVTQVETIRFSNPRWGSPLTNKFETVEEWRERMKKYIDK